jgi:hypothetical protein
MADSTHGVMMLESARVVFSLPNGSEKIVNFDVTPRLVYPSDTVTLSFVIPNGSPSKNVRHGLTWGFRYRLISFLKTIGSMTK